MTDVSDKTSEAYEKVPLGWKLEKLKFFADVRNSNVDKSISEYEQPVRLCNYTDIYYNDRITSNMHFMEGSATKAEIELFQLRRDQVIVTKDSEDWDDIGIPALVTEDMPDVLCGYHLSVFEAGLDLDGGFLAWLCRSESLNDQFKLAANGVTRFGLSQYAMKNAFILFPPLDTQRRITEYLDKKTVQIDRLIEKKRELLNLLAEKRRALITQTVTKGFPDSQWSEYDRHESDLRRDCRAEGRCYGSSDNSIPENWSSKRIKYLATYNDEVLPEDSDEGKEISYIEISGVSLTNGIEHIENTTFGEAPSRARRKVRCGDILISTVRTYLRAIAKLDEVPSNLIASTGFCVIRPKNVVDSGFLGWAVKSELIISEVVARSVGVSYPAINASDLVTIHIPLPPRESQRQIADFLDEKTARIDQLTERIRESITLLEEYRSVLITAVVTGQTSVPK